MKEMQEAERERQILEAKKREKEELKDKAPVLEVATPIMIDPAPIIIVDTPKPKSEEGLSGKDIEVIEDALEKLGKCIGNDPIFFREVQVHHFAFLITYSTHFCHSYK